MWMLVCEVASIPTQCKLCVWIRQKEYKISCVWPPDVTEFGQKGEEFERRRKVRHTGLNPAGRDVVQRAERWDGLLHPDIQGAHAPGARASQNPRCGRREEERHVPQTVPQKLPAPLPQADGEQEHSAEATLHCSSYLVRPLVVGHWKNKRGEAGEKTGLRHRKWRWEDAEENVQGLMKVTEDLSKER